MSSFQEDLAAGLHVESLVLSVLQKKYPCATMVNAFKGYDIWIPETHKSVEVKYDRMSNTTGNFFVEVEYNGKASGLITTTADYWLIYDDRCFAWIKPRRLFECIMLNELAIGNYDGVKGSAYKRGYLVKKELLYVYADSVTKP